MRRVVLLAREESGPHTATPCARTRRWPMPANSVTTTGRPADRATSSPGSPPSGARARPFCRDLQIRTGPWSGAPRGRTAQNAEMCRAIHWPVQPRDRGAGGVPSTAPSALRTFARPAPRRSDLCHYVPPCAAISRLVPPNPTLKIAVGTSAGPQGQCGCGVAGRAGGADRWPKGAARTYNGGIE